MARLVIVAEGGPSTASAAASSALRPGRHPLNGASLKAASAAAAAHSDEARRRRSTPLRSATTAVVAPAAVAPSSLGEALKDAIAQAKPDELRQLLSVDAGFPFAADASQPSIGEVVDGYVDGIGRSLLHLCAESLTAEPAAGAACLRLLLTSGASCDVVNRIDRLGETALLLAVRAAATDAAMSGADGVVDGAGGRLHRSMFAGGLGFGTPEPSPERLGAVRLLLEAEADPNITGPSIAHETPLMEAACSGSESLCRLLLDFRADPRWRSEAGLCAVDFLPEQQTQTEACAFAPSLLQMLLPAACPEADSVVHDAACIPQQVVDFFAEEVGVSDEPPMHQHSSAQVFRLDDSSDEEVGGIVGVAPVELSRNCEVFRLDSSDEDIAGGDCQMPSWPGSRCQTPKVFRLDVSDDERGASVSGHLQRQAAPAVQQPLWAAAADAAPAGRAAAAAEPPRPSERRRARRSGFSALLREGGIEAQGPRGEAEEEPAPERSPGAQEVDGLASRPQGPSAELVEDLASLLGRRQPQAEGVAAPRRGRRRPRSLCAEDACLRGESAEFGGSSSSTSTPRGSEAGRTSAQRVTQPFPGVGTAGLLAGSPAVAEPTMSPELVRAVSAADPPVVRRLLRALPDARAALSARDDDGRTLLHLCVQAPPNDKVFAIVALLLQYGAEADARTNFGETPLLVAARAASEAVAGTAGGGEAGAEAPWSRPLRRLLEAGADPDGADLAGDTPLVEAACQGSVQVCSLLLAARADAIRRPPMAEPTSIAELAESEGHLDVAELLRAAADGSLGGGGRAASALPPAGATRAESPRLGSRGPRWDADEPRRGPECSARAASGSCVSDLFADGDDDANEANTGASSCSDHAAWWHSSVASSTETPLPATESSSPPSEATQGAAHDEDLEEGGTPGALISEMLDSALAEEARLLGHAAAWPWCAAESCAVPVAEVGLAPLDAFAPDACDARGRAEGGPAPVKPAAGVASAAGESASGGEAGAAPTEEARRASAAASKGGQFFDFDELSADSEDPRPGGAHVEAARGDGAAEATGAAAEDEDGAAAHECLARLRSRCELVGFSAEWCQRAADLEELLEFAPQHRKLSVRELKQRCVQRGLAVDGARAKEDVVERLRQVAIWDRMPVEQLQIECSRHGITSFSGGDRSRLDGFNSAHGDDGGFAERLVGALIAWANAAARPRQGDASSSGAAAAGDAAVAPDAGARSAPSGAPVGSASAGGAATAAGCAASAPPVVGGASEDGLPTSASMQASALAVVVDALHARCELAEISVAPYLWRAAADGGDAALEVVRRLEDALDFNARHAKLPVRELRERCAARNMSIEGAMEKSDIVTRLRQAALWDVMPVDELLAECRRLGVADVSPLRHSGDDALERSRVAELVAALIAHTFGARRADGVHCAAAEAPPRGPAGASPRPLPGVAATRLAAGAPGSTALVTNEPAAVTKLEMPGATARTPPRPCAEGPETLRSRLGSPTAQPTAQKTTSASSTRSRRPASGTTTPRSTTASSASSTPGATRRAAPPKAASGEATGDWDFSGLAGGRATPLRQAGGRAAQGGARAASGHGTGVGSAGRVNYGSGAGVGQHHGQQQPRPKAKPKARQTRASPRRRPSRQFHKSCSSDEGDEEAKRANLGPRVRKYLDKFPAYSGDMPPPEAEDIWTDQDLHNFFFSSGFIRPPRREKKKVTPAMLNEFYRALGLPPGAKAPAVRKVYRQLALKHHPDKNSDSRDATTKFQEITEAYHAIIHNLEVGAKNAA